MVPDAEEPGVLGAEAPPPGVDGGEDAGDRVGEESAQPPGCVGAGGEVAGGAGREDAVADPGRPVGGAEEGVGCHHQLDLDRHGPGGGLAGQPLHEQVGHDLGLGAVVAGGLLGPGSRAQAGPRRDSLADREQRGHVGHRVGRGADGDSPVACRLGGATDRGLRVELPGQRPRRALDTARCLVQHPRLLDQPGELIDGHRRQPLVHHLAVLQGEDRGLPDQHRGRPLVDLAPGQQVERVWHLLHRLGEPEMARTLRGRAAPGQGDLVADAPAALVATYAGGFLPGQLGGLELTRDPCLRRSRRRLDLLEQPDLVDPVRVGRRVPTHIRRPGHGGQVVDHPLQLDGVRMRPNRLHAGDEQLGSYRCCGHGNSPAEATDSAAGRRSRAVDEG